MKALNILDKLEFKKEENRETVTEMLYDLIETDVFINEIHLKKKRRKYMIFLKTKENIKLWNF